MPRQKIPMVFGRGLSRESGIMATAPATFENLKNVFVDLGKAKVRKGLTSKFSLAGTTDIIGIHSFRFEQAGLVFAYNDPTGEVFSYRTTGVGENPNQVDAPNPVWTITAESDVPRVLFAESYAKLFFAHDEPLVSKRQVSKFYDPFSTPQINTLQADLDGNGVNDIIFRGVTRHLNYLFGWGFGTDSERDRHEIVRVSKPGEPEVFLPEHYFIVGTRGDPVLACVPAGPNLLSFKETEIYAITGYSRANFGVQPLDMLYGVASSRLAVNVGGVCFFWSLQGPRMCDGTGPSQDLALPLDLDGPQPESLVTENELQNAFAHYDPVERVVLFVFGKRVYVLSLRTSRPEWSYIELGQEAFCAGTLYSGGTSLADGPIGYPDAAPAGDGDSSQVAQNIAPTTVDIHWVNVDPIGGELVEIWTKPSGGAWASHKTVSYNGNVNQNTTIDSLSPGTDYEVALRYRRGGTFTTGYEGTDPTLWPAKSKGLFTTTLLAPTIDNFDWDRIAKGHERLTLNFTAAHSGLDIKLYRSNVQGGPYTLIDTITGGTLFYNDESNDEQLADPDTEWGEKYYYYVATHATTAQESPNSSEVQAWGGPAEPVITQLDTFSGGCYDVFWDNSEPGGVGAYTEIWEENFSEPTAFQEADNSPVAISGTDDTLNNCPVGWGDPSVVEGIRISVRHRIVFDESGPNETIDFSDFDDISGTIPTGPE